MYKDARVGASDSQVGLIPYFRLYQGRVSATFDIFRAFPERREGMSPALRAEERPSAYESSLFDIPFLGYTENL